MKHPAIATGIWDQKYRFKDENGNPIDQDVQGTWRRIANALAKPEGTDFSEARNLWADHFYNALEDYKYLPAGRITSGAGTGRAVTLFNCYVMGTIPDSIAGIFDMLKEAAQTMQQGGGIGYDFSTIRPAGALVKGVAADASGPLTFMDCWDSMCRTIMSAGERRGAMMGTMRCDHPDIEAFIEAKKDASRFRMFNLSVLVTDPFMLAVKNDWDWDLRFGDKVFRTVRAKELWDKIIQTTYDVAEPGVIFIDRINKANNLNYCETIAATNPCGEQPLPPYGACLLGSINLARLVTDPFTDEAALDLDQVDQLVSTAVRMMDNTVDVSLFPVDEQKVEALAKRRIGLGVTGLADALAMCQVKYGSDDGAAVTDEWMEAIALSAYQASIDLAKEKGAFPLFNADGFLREGSFAATRLPAEMQDEIRQFGIRNALLTSIAPTGTISLYAGNVSSGVEPIFAYGYTRKVLNGDGSHREEEVVDYAVALYKEMFPGTELPSYFTTAQDLTPLEHLRMQAAAQRWVDSAISKTINCPEDISFEDFQKVYELAYDMGCKGCTTYRPNDVTGSVLSVKSDEPTEAPVVEASTPVGRPRKLKGGTFKLKWPNEPHAFYISFTEKDGNPYEMFINSKNVEHFAWITALTRMVSAIFRRGGEVSFVAQELREVFDPKGGAYLGGKYVPSLIAAIGDIVAEHMTDIGYGSFKPAKVVDQDPPVIEVEANAHEWDPVAAEAHYSGSEGVDNIFVDEEPAEGEDGDAFVFSSRQVKAPPTCKDCGSFNMQMQGGCQTCGDCGSSKCG